MSDPRAREAALDAYLAHYAAGRYFDAHEVLEGVWHRSGEAPMRLLHGLIQWAVALEHHRRGNAHGARALLDRAMVNLADAPPGYMDLDLSRCRAAAPGLRNAFAAWERGGPRPGIVAPELCRRGGGDVPDVG